MRNRLGLSATHFVLLTACRLTGRKGVDFLIRSLPGVLKKYPDIILLVAGDGAKRHQLVRLAASIGMEARVRFPGSVPQTDIHRIFALADAFVLASRTQMDPLLGVRDAETMGRVLCEANAAGVPVMAADSGGIPSVIQNGVNGLLFTPDSAGSLLQALTRLRENPAATAAMVEAGRRRAREEFDWRIIVDKHAACFSEALREGAKSRRIAHRSHCA